MGPVQKTLALFPPLCRGSNVSQVWLPQHSVYTWFSLHNSQGLWKHFLEPPPKSHNYELVNTNWKSTVYFKCNLGSPSAQCLLRLHVASVPSCPSQPRCLLSHHASWVSQESLSPALEFLTPRHRSTKSMRRREEGQTFWSPHHNFTPLLILQLVQLEHAYLAFKKYCHLIII